MTEEIWNIEVKEDKPEIVDIPAGYILRLTNVAALYNGLSGWCPLYFKTNTINTKRLVSTMYHNVDSVYNLKLDSKLDLVFAPNTQVEFSISTTPHELCTLSLTGYLEPRPMHGPHNASLQANATHAAFYPGIFLSCFIGLLYYIFQSRRPPQRPITRDD